MILVIPICVGYIKEVIYFHYLLTIDYNSISCDMNQGIDQSPDKETRLSNSSLNNNSTQQSNSDNMQQEFDFIDAGNDDSFSNEDFDNVIYFVLFFLFREFNKRKVESVIITMKLRENISVVNCLFLV